MNTQSVDCRKVKFSPENGIEGMEKPGDFCFDEKREHIYIWLPCDKGGPSALRIVKGQKPPENRVWGWDGNEDKPTLTPSINAPGEWHGWLRNGRLESC